MMPKLFKVFLLLLISCITVVTLEPIASVEAKSQTATLRVGTYNIFLGGDLENQQKIKKLVNQLDIDIIAYQEVYTHKKNGVDVLKNLSDKSTKTLLRATAITDGDRTDYGTGALSKLKAINTSTIKVKPLGEEQRIMGKMEFNINDKKLIVYTVHVSWITKGQKFYCRPQQFNFILNTIKKDQADYKIILGDFNIEDYSDYQPFIDAGFKLANSPSTPFETFRWNQYDHGYKNIDNIIVTPNIDIVDPAMVDIALSDHNLFYADLLLK